MSSTVEDIVEAAAGPVRALLGPCAGRPSAVRRLHDDGLFGPDDRVAVAVIRPFAPGGRPDTTATGQVLSRAMRAVGNAVPPTSALQLRRADHGVLVIRVPARSSSATVDRVSCHALAAVRSVADRAPGRISLLLGVGDERSCLADAIHSYREARLAALAGGAMPDSGQPLRWRRLGVWQAIAELVDDPARRPTVHPGLRGLLADPGSLPLLETLETYLDLAGNAQRASQLLGLHRGSLYHRLQRIEELVGSSLKDGGERLALHVELKMARMIGEYRPRRH